MLLLLLLGGCLLTAAADDMCHFYPNTAFEEGLDAWSAKAQATSKEECCAICRGTPQCFVGNYVSWGGIYPPYPGKGPVNIYGQCYMRGKVNTSAPTSKQNTTACLVAGARPAAKPAPSDDGGCCKIGGCPRS